MAKQMLVVGKIVKRGGVVHMSAVTEPGYPFNGINWGNARVDHRSARHNLDGKCHYCLNDLHWKF